MGSTKPDQTTSPDRGLRATTLATLTALTALAIGASACDTTTTEDVNVGPAAAYTAIVEWQVDAQEPAVDDNGEAVTPVVFVVNEDGTTIDAGVQAAVAAATAAWATVRFADQATEAFDSDVDGEPVRDDGVMLSIGPVPDAARTIELGVTRYVAVDQSEAFLVQVTATPGPANTSAISPRASVSSVSTVSQP